MMAEAKCKTCGRLRTGKYRERIKFVGETALPDYYVQIVRDGVQYVADATCGACKKKDAVRRILWNLERARKALAAAEANAQKQHEKLADKALRRLS